MKKGTLAPCPAPGADRGLASPARTREYPMRAPSGTGAALGIPRMRTRIGKMGESGARGRYSRRS